MKTLTIPIGQQLLGAGLVPNKNPKNRPGLDQAIGAVPFQKVLVSLWQYTAEDTASLGTPSFPYPQMFVFPKVTVVCMPTEIFELMAGSLISKIDGLTAGDPWSAYEYAPYIYLTNRLVTVVKDPDSSLYRIDDTVPSGSAVLQWNGQVFIGSPSILTQ